MLKGNMFKIIIEFYTIEGGPVGEVMAFFVTGHHFKPRVVNICRKGY